MARPRLSRPLTIALEDGLIAQSDSIFDYGCGRGDDLRNLRAAGYLADGWDPVHLPAGTRHAAEVVNLGYVVNVVEDPEERRLVLGDAWALTQRLLIVSARLTVEARDLIARHFSDGLVTSRGTFQKFFEQHELATWIEQSLGVAPVAAAPGVFYVFRRREDAEGHLAAHVRTYRPRLVLDPHELFDQHRDVLTPLIDFVTQHGRDPRQDELGDALLPILDAVGSLRRAYRLLQQVTPPATAEAIARHRRQELLIYVALSRFRKRPRLNQLPTSLARDLRFHFGTYEGACREADQLLFATGSRDAIFVSAHASPVGKLTPTALYVHRDAIRHLPPLLRLYEGCARVLVGAVEGANIVKLHVAEPKVSFLAYPTFDRVGHPALSASLVVSLDRLTVRIHDYARSSNPPVLHRKEEFVHADDARRVKFSRLTKAEVRAGLYEDPARIGTQSGWDEVLRARGLVVKGHRLVRSPAL